MTDHIVVFEGNERLTGQTVSVRIDDATSFTLFGTVETGEQVGVADDVCSAPPEPVPVENGPSRIALPLV
jgi:tRNA-2-methylthio-N6-dimethylallyladenosine synthase